MTVCIILNLSMQLMCNLHTLYFLLAGYAKMVFVHWLKDLHTYLGLLTDMLRCNLRSRKR